MNYFDEKEMFHGKNILWHHQKRKISFSGKHFQNYYEVTLIMDGIGNNIVNNKQYVASKNEIIFMNKNVQHELISNDEIVTLNYLNIAFNEVIYKNILTIFPDFAPPKEACVYHINKNDIEQLLNMYATMNINESYFTVYKEVELFLYHLIHKMMKTRHDNQKMYPLWFEKIISEFEKEEALIAGIRYLYQLSPYSKQYTIKQFQRYLNINPSEYINFLRCEKAVKLLGSTNKSMTEISIDIGFSSLEYFDKVFKKIKGYTPLQYKKEIQKLKTGKSLFNK